MPYSLSKPSATILAQGAKILSDNQLTAHSPSHEKAAAVFRFVRDEIRFGFTRHFDDATPEQTLLVGRGHCNAQSALFASLLNGVGVKARQEFVELSPGVLHGVVPWLPRVLLHSCAVVTTDEGTWRVDGFIASRGLLEGAKRLLEREGRTVGYGVAGDGCVEWDGRGDCFVQMTTGVGEVLGRFDEPDKLLGSDKNFQRLGFVGRALLAVGAGSMKRRVDEIEAGRG